MPKVNSCRFANYGSLRVNESSRVSYLIPSKLNSYWVPGELIDAPALTSTACLSLLTLVLYVSLNRFKDLGLVSILK